MRYRTIVADPPWPIHSHGARTPASRGNWNGKWLRHVAEVPYETLTVDEIKALPVSSLAAADAHLYLWAINEFLLDAYEVAKAWGFRPAILLTWCKEPMGLGFGGAYANTTEFILFCRCGSLPPLRRWESTWFKFKRQHENGAPAHSKKPDGFLDIVEQVSPEPRLELFARRNRFGWDTWGDEALNHVEVGS